MLVRDAVLVVFAAVADPRVGHRVDRLIGVTAMRMDCHQQYLAKVPHGYCGIGGTGVSCPVGTGISQDPAVS